MHLNNLVKEGDYISYGRSGVKIFDLVYGIGKVLGAEGSLVRTETWEFTGSCLGESVNLETILTSGLSHGEWVKNEKIVDVARNDYEIGSGGLKNSYLLVEGWIKYGWDKVLNLRLKELEEDIKKRAETYDEFVAENGEDETKYTNEQLSFVLPYKLVAKILKGK